MKKVVYLIKDNDELCSHCTCETAYITFPPQMGCPWCGCGWLFTCTSCQKAFTFARAIEVDESWKELARRDLVGKWTDTPSDEDIDAWIEAMQAILSNVEIGKQYVCLDGLIIPTDASRVRFQGWHSEHDLEFVPHVAALDDYFVMENILCNRDYWQSRAIHRDDKL
jgi:hypothetical protein